jgi:hypothetical protein
LKDTYTNREIPAEHFHEKRFEASPIFEFRMRYYRSSQNGMTTSSKFNILARIFEILVELIYFDNGFE